jgi:hypothetical protein
MRKLIGLSLAFLVLCGFGFGPFYGENRTPAAAGGSPPTYLSSASYGASSVTSTHSFNATLPAGSNRVLLVAFTIYDISDTAHVVSVKYGGSGGTAMTLLSHHRPASGTVHEGDIYYLLESDLSGYSGDNDIYIQYDESVYSLGATAVFLGGVNQSTPFGAVSSADFLSGSAAITVSPASTTNDLVVGFGFWDTGGGSDPSAVTSPATERARVKETNNNRRWNLAATTPGEASSTAIGWDTPAQTYQDVFISAFAVQ